MRKPTLGSPLAPALVALTAALAIYGCSAEEREFGGGSSAASASGASSSSAASSGSGGMVICEPGSLSACYSGPPGTEGVGLCEAGVHACNLDGDGYGECVKEVTPAPEACGAPEDEDCDGLTNEADPDCSMCGDGTIQTGEECDDGNVADNDGCPSTCKIAKCGDGFTQDGVEECDDGNVSDGDACSSTCGKRRVVFVTSAMYPGALGGLAGADAICQQAAASGGLSGVFMAWLSDVALGPAARMVHGKGDYALTTGEVIAAGWADLTDGSLLHPIDRDQYGNTSQGTFVCQGGEVWTNTTPNGNPAGGGDCGGWTSSLPTSRAGNVKFADPSWTLSNCINITCGSALPLYCFEQ